MGGTAFEEMCQEFKLKYNDKTSPYTHTLLTGGKYCFSDNDLLQISPIKPVKKTSASADRTRAPNIDRQDFIQQYQELFKEIPTVAEFAYVALLWWWQHRASDDTEGISLTARKTPDLFFMYFDLDMKYPVLSVWDDSKWKEQQWKIASIVYNTVNFYFEGPGHDMTVAATPNARHLESLECYKVGMHLYFPTLVVSFAEAMRLLHAVQVRVREMLGERDLRSGENAWTDVFDTSVYRGGLRDCYTFKPNNCQSCCTLNSESTDGKWLRYSVYEPLFIISECARVDITPELKQERNYIFGGGYDLTLHRLTRIRCTDQEAIKLRGVFRDRNPSAIGYIPLGEHELPDRPSRKPREDPLQYPDDLKALSKMRQGGKPEVLYFSPEDLCRIETCVREHFDEARYGHVQIRTIYAFFWRDTTRTVDVLGQPSRISKVKITLKGEGSRYCFNKGDYHHNNTAYFEISVKNSSLVVFEQRCWSPHLHKSAGTLKVCNRFRSGQVKKYGRVSTAVTRLLFHNEKGHPQISPPSP